MFTFDRIIEEDVSMSAIELFFIEFTFIIRLNKVICNSNDLLLLFTIFKYQMCFYLAFECKSPEKLMAEINGFRK